MIRVDGIAYDLDIYREGITTTAYKITADGKPVMPDVVVVQHHGASADCKYCILGPGLPRLEADNQNELFEKIAKVVHG